MNIPDHPIIRNMERTGYPNGHEPIGPICPICGERCDYIYKALGSIVGCDVCIDVYNSEDVLGEEDEA